MFFQLPISATASNWLSDWLVNTLTTGFDTLDGGSLPSFDYSGLSSDRAAALQARVKLLDSISEVHVAYFSLAPADRLLVREALADEWDLPALLAGGGSARTRAELPEQVREPLDDLSRTAFAALKDLGIRKVAYAHHFAGGAGRTCTFCGYEYLDGPRCRNPDWDHYLARSLYPFASFNPANLAPMGDGCNQRYKGSKDILREPGGARRPCFDPYAAATPRTVVHLRNSDLSGGKGSPRWEVTIDGDAARIASWDAVFRIRDRWNDHLDVKYKACLRHIGTRFARSTPPTDAGIAALLAEEAAPAAHPPHYGDDLLRVAIFDMLNHAFAPGSPHRGPLGALFRSLVRERGKP